MTMRKPIPTFETQTKGAFHKDTRNGACAALFGALVAGLAFGSLGFAGVAVALLGVFLTVAGLGMMFGPRPLDSTLYRAAVAVCRLNLDCAPYLVKVNAKSAPLKIGTLASAYKRAVDKREKERAKAAKVKVSGVPAVAYIQAAVLAYNAKQRMELERWRLMLN